MCFHCYSVSGFEFTRETGVFDLLDVPLCHGWVVDPQSAEWYGVVKDLSYNQLAEMVIRNSSSEDPKLMEEGIECSNITVEPLIDKGPS